MLPFVDGIVAEGIIPLRWRWRVEADAEAALEGGACKVCGLVGGAGQAAEEGACGSLAGGDEECGALEVAVGAFEGADVAVETDPAGVIDNRGKVVRSTGEL